MIVFWHAACRTSRANFSSGIIFNFNSTRTADVLPHVIYYNNDNANYIRTL